MFKVGDHVQIIGNPRLHGRVVAVQQATVNVRFTYQKEVVLVAIGRLEIVE